MREILFRGKTIDGDWTYGYYVFTPKRTGMFGQTINEADFDRHYILTMKYNLVKEINPETVGQYTGLTDKNGKKIFEGDIVNVNTNKDTLCHRYEVRNLVIEFDEYHRFIANGRLSYPLCNHYEWEVIDNIHDKLELLKGGEG